MKKPVTPKSKITACIRQLWLRSRERAFTIKRDKYTCQNCGIKQSKAKGKEQAVVVHHVDGINWENITEMIRVRVLAHPDRLITLCPDCHKEAHK